VELADYGLDIRSEKIFLRLRDEGGGEYCYLLDKDQCVQFARGMLLHGSDQPPGKGGVN
jgi:hypothetical protein